MDAVIGPLTSNMLPAVQSVSDAEVLLFSPIMSTSQLSGLDDHFVRANLTITHQAEMLAEKMIHDGIQRTVVVFDTANRQHTEELVTHFRNVFHDRGGVVTGSHPFDSAVDPNYLEIAADIIADHPPAVVFVTTGIDAGVIAQQLWKQNVETDLYAAEWAKTSDIVAAGGRAVNGMVIVTQFLPDEPTVAYDRFNRRYQRLYGSTPTFAAQYAYETANILLNAIDRADTPELDELKSHIVGQTHKGLAEQIAIDSYGDATRTAAFARIDNGRFIIETLETTRE